MPKPGLFADFSKKCDDILEDNYVENTKVAIKSLNALSPFTINTTTVRGNNGAITGDVQAKFKHDSGINGSLKVSESASGKAEVSYKLPSMDLKLTGTGAFDASNSGKNSFKASSEFKHESFTTTAGVDTAGGVSVFGSVCAGFSGVQVGGDAKYDVAGGKLKSYAAGFKYDASNGLSLAGLYKSNGICQSLLTHKFGDKATLAAVFDHNRIKKENKATLGAEYDVDKDEKIAVKASTTGLVHGSYQFKATHICSVNLSACVNSRELKAGEGHKMGMSFTFEDQN